MNTSEEQQITCHLMYKEVERGVGINAHEYEAIKQISSQLYLSKMEPKAKEFSERLKKQFGSDWLIFIYPINNDDDCNELYITAAKEINSVSFVIDNTKFHIYRLNLQ